LPEGRFESAAEVGKLLEAPLRHLQDPVSWPLPAVLIQPNDAPMPNRHWPRVLLGIVFCVVASSACGIIWLPRKLAPNVNPLPSPANFAESSHADAGVMKLDLEFLDLIAALNREIDSVEKQLTHPILHASQT